MNGGNGDYVEYTYDKLDRVSYKKYNGTNLGFWGYYANGQVGYFYDYASGKIYYYFYDSIGRFINADTYTTTDADGLLSTNMFAYCENNPIMGVDPTGEFLDTVFYVVSLCISAAEVVANPADPWAWAGLVGDVVDLIPGVTGVGETVRLLKTSDRVVDVAKGLRKSGKLSDKVKKGTGSYEIIFNNGMTYVGKGGYNRMIKSAERYGGDVKTMKWTKANSHREAFINEYKTMCKYGGPNNKMANNPLSLNKIWSPGRNYYLQDYGTYYSYGGRVW